MYSISLLTLPQGSGVQSHQLRSLNKVCDLVLSWFIGQDILCDCHWGFGWCEFLQILLKYGLDSLDFITSWHVSPQTFKDGGYVSRVSLDDFKHFFLCVQVLFSFLIISLNFPVILHDIPCYQDLTHYCWYILKLKMNVSRRLQNWHVGLAWTLSTRRPQTAAESEREP